MFVVSSLVLFVSVPSLHIVCGSPFIYMLDNKSFVPTRIKICIAKSKHSFVQGMSLHITRFNCIANSVMLHMVLNFVVKCMEIF